MRKSPTVFSPVLKDELQAICGNLEYILEKIEQQDYSFMDAYDMGDIACLRMDIDSVYKKIAHA